MGITRKEATIDVVKAAEIRIKNIFANGVPVYMSFSGGKDSLCMANVTMELIQRGEIDPKLLIVQFIDEEAIFPCIEKKVMEWRRKFMMCGAKFEWYCLQVKHFNCFNQLENDESFICWDETIPDRWVRKPPAFAIRNHKLLRERIDTYQIFLARRCAAGISMIGIRTAESLQRLQNFARMTNKKGSKGRKKMFPIYDWTDKDVWLYLKEKKVDIPDIYLYMWQSGANKRQMRVSQFFSVDTARSLVKMNEYYPDLLDSVVRREPNAYLAALYWDTEMFGRSTKSRKEMEKGSEQKDYRAELHNLFKHIDLYFDTPHKKAIAVHYRNFYYSCMSVISEKDLKRMYESLLGGDPKSRNLRALYQSVFTEYANNAKKEEQNG